MENSNKQKRKYPLTNPPVAEAEADVAMPTASSSTREKLGLTANIEGVEDGAHDAIIPEPYSETCITIKDSNENHDSLVKLAKHVFFKLSQKQNSTGKWNPTPIQLQSWPILKANLNIIAIATTGSGKTLAYAIPMVDSCMKLDKLRAGKLRRNVHGLVLLPTRELAIQVSKVLKVAAKSGNKLSGNDNIVAMVTYGGVDREEQIDALSQRKEFILAATPMRLIDLLGIGEGMDANKEVQALFESTRYLVIDEADTMATKSDMAEQVDLILKFLRSKSTCLDTQCLFSATLPRRAIKKCNAWIDMPRVTVKVDTVTVGTSVNTELEEPSKNDNEDEGNDAAKEKADKAAARGGPLDLSTIPAHITQTLHVCANHKKPAKLMNTIKKIREADKVGNRRRKGLIIIFFGKIKTLQYMHGLLIKDNVQCVPFHSQMNQQKREMNLNQFRCGKTPILLATDIAARGLHCNNVEYIINYDFPGSLEQVSL